MDQGSAFRPLDSSAIQQALQSSKLHMPVLDFSESAPLPHGSNHIDNVEMDRMDRASQGSQEKTASLWEPSPSIQPPNLPVAAERMASSVAGSAQRQSATPSVASSRPTSPRQVDVSTQTALPLKLPAAENAAATSRIIDWVPDTPLSSIGYILGSLKDEVKTQPYARSMVSELERLWFPAPPPEPIQPPPTEAPARVPRAPSVVVEERDSNPPSVVSQQEQSPARRSLPPPDRTIANSRRDHNTSIDDEIDHRPVEPRVTHEGPPSVIGDGPVEDTEKRWFDQAEWEALVTQLTSKMVKSTLEALQPTVREYVQQYLKDIHPAKVDPPLVEYLDEAAAREVLRDTVDETCQRSKARSPPRGLTVDDTYFERKKRYEQDSRYTEYDQKPSPIAKSQFFNKGATDTERYDTPEPSNKRPSTDAEYDANGSRYTSWPQKEVRWADTTRDSERTHPPAQRDFDDWMPRSSVPRSRNGMRIKFTQNGPRTRGSRREPQVGGYDRFELKTEVPESRRQRFGRFQGGFNRGRRW